MTFTRVFAQLKRKEKQCIGSKLHSTGKTQCKRVKKVTKSNQQGVLFLKKIDVNAKREDKLTHKITQQKNTEAEIQKNVNFEVFWAKGGWRSVAKGKERYSALCKATKSVGALITLSQGRQGLKVPEMSRKFKN
jgi:hypothetical protein